MGLLGAFQFLPALLFGLPAGVWLDRTRRQPVLVAAQLVNMAALATVPAAALLHVLSLPQLYAVGFVAGAANTFFTIAQSAFLPTFAGRENLVEASAKYQTSMTVASLAGPGLAGFLVQVLTAPIAIAFDAASFLVGALTAAWIRVTEPPPASATAVRNPLREAREGLVFLWTHPLVRSITLTIISANMGGRLSSAVFLLLFVGQLGVTPVQIGIAFAVGSFSSLVGAQVTKPLVDRGRLGTVMVAGAALFAFGIALTVPAALAPRPWIFPMLLAVGLISGFGLMAYNINQQAIRGSVVPNEMLGRVSAGLFVVVALGNVAGSLIGGALGQRIGLFGAIVVASAVSATSVLPAIFSPLGRLRAVPAPE
jgi:MFS family permease